MDFTKEIWYLFKLNRNEYNTAERKIDKLLIEVYNKGIKAGRKEQANKTIQFSKHV